VVLSISEGVGVSVLSIAGFHVSTGSNAPRADWMA
jgi:hypothetical protein